MRDVPVAGLGLLVVVSPLFELAVIADLHRREPIGRGAKLLGERPVAREDFRGRRTVGEQIGEELDVHRRRGRDRHLVAVGADVGVLRRERGGRHEVALVVGEEKVEEELRGLAHGGVRLRRNASSRVNR